MSRRILSIFILVAAPAFARDTQGMLDVIRIPNNGIPVILQQGGAFEAVLIARGELSLRAGDHAYPLSAEWSGETGGMQRARCTLPTELPAGAYALEWKTPEKTDTNLRSVYVLETFPEYYVIAHLSDTHLGKERPGKRPSEDINMDLVQKINATEAAFVAITGDLTETGAPEQFQAFLRVIDTCALPTFVCPGNHDRQDLNYERYFGPTEYAFTYGKDGYLSYDTKDLITADELCPQDGRLEVLRRALKPCRWSIGLTHRYEPMQGMRSQLVLFVDNPLDYLLFGHWHHENSPDQPTVPWGTTKITVVPAAVNGAYRLIDVTAKGLLPRPYMEVDAE